VPRPATPARPIAAERSLDHMAPDQSHRGVGVAADTLVRHYAAHRRTARVATAPSPPTLADGGGDEYGARMHRTRHGAPRETEPAATEPACAISRETPGSATRGRAGEPRGHAAHVMSITVVCQRAFDNRRPLSVRDVA